MVAICYYCNLPKEKDVEYKETEGQIVDLIPCAECKAYMEDGIMILLISDRLSDPGWDKEPVPNPFRLGSYYVINEHDLRLIFGYNEQIVEYALGSRFLFVDELALDVINQLDRLVNSG